MNPRILLRLKAVRLFGDGIGCTDGGCVFGHAGGMHTNGGCACIKSSAFVVAQRLAQLALELAKDASK